MKPIIEVHNISKVFKINKEHKPYLSLRDSVMELFSFLSSKKESFTALKEINFNLMPGDTLGIIGRNGAGKSTLLKILSRITPPTEGKIICRGRLASLLEVGTGFHPELSGRENIFFNGSVLGMKKKEIVKNFDAIVDFSGVAKFIDTPLKHYSSGMQLRLAFAVAAFLENEILVIDEVLAVGDAEFQKKCIGKMNEASKSGRTIIYVSHNLNSISQLCTRGLLINKGILKFSGSSNEAIEEYIKENYNLSTDKQLTNTEKRYGSGSYRVESIELLDKDRRAIEIGKTGETLIFKCNLSRKVALTEGYFKMDFSIDDEKENRIGWFSTDINFKKNSNEFSYILLIIPKLPFGRGRYALTFYSTLNHQLVDYINQGFYFDIEEGNYFGNGKIIPKEQTNIYINHDIELLN